MNGLSDHDAQIINLNLNLNNNNKSISIRPISEATLINTPWQNFKTT
jgi:hypothetical protein